MSTPTQVNENPLNFLRFYLNTSNHSGHVIVVSKMIDILSFGDILSEYRFSFSCKTSNGLFSDGSYLLYTKYTDLRSSKIYFHTAAEKNEIWFLVQWKSKWRTVFCESRGNRVVMFYEPIFIWIGNWILFSSSSRHEMLPRQLSFLINCLLTTTVILLVSIFAFAIN